MNRIAVNLSSIQFQRGDIVESVKRVLKDTGVSPQQLELEITEGLVMQKTDWAVSVLENLKQLGITISIDDFGTGYSSLSYLKRLQVDKLKIDKSFVRDIPHGPNDEAIARAVVALGQSLNLEVIAEGVETDEQHEDENYYLIYDHPHSFEADAWLSHRDKTNFCVCFMNAGYSAGWCEESFGMPLRTREITCRAKGDEHCRFIMAPPHKVQDYVDNYIANNPELFNKGVSEQA